MAQDARRAGLPRAGGPTGHSSHRLSAIRAATVGRPLQPPLASEPGSRLMNNVWRGLSRLQFRIAYAGHLVQCAFCLTLYDFPATVIVAARPDGPGLIAAV